MKLEKYMDFTNPTEAFAGVRRAIQGFGVHNRYGYVLYHTGICAVYDLVTKAPEPLTVFRLGAYCDGPDKRYINHANDLVLAEVGGKTLMYIQAGNSGETDGKGFIAYCDVEELLGEGAQASTRLVQKIYYNNIGIEQTAYQTPAWGWPCYLPDAENCLLYMFSARYRTTNAFLDKYDENNYIVTAFRLPDPSLPEVTLTPADILYQHELPFDILFTQGGTVHRGLIFFTFGCKEKYPDGVRIIDPAAGKVLERLDLHESILGAEELECCAFTPDGDLLLNTGSGRLYRLETETTERLRRGE